MWIIMVWQHISPEATMKGFKKCCISDAVDATDDDTFQYVSEEDGDFRSKCEEDEGTDCEDGDSDTDGKHTQNLTCFVNQVYEIVKYFSLADISFLGGSCRL